ncbi:MAG TPA: insulinase family protein [Longimicrobiales bacterium]|nr:insulinase family protein [Longimicrobiales bacterium]
MENESFLQRLPTHVRQLDNGLTVIVREDHRAPVVAVVTHVRAGYFDEPDHLVGISHVLEHMYFKGTARRPPGRIAQETKEAGGYLNAGTIYDRTSYYTVLPAAALEQALDIQADALQHSVIDEDELRRELQVIIQEAKRKLDNPDAFAQESLFASMFDMHRIRRWRIGTEDMLAGFTRDDVHGFYRRFYRAGNTTLVIAGDVAADTAFALAERYYGGMDGGSVEGDRGDEEPASHGMRYRELDGDIGQTLVEWGWRTPGTLHDDTPALDVLAVALGQGRASRLYRHVRDAGLVSAISSYNYTPTVLGIFGIGAELKPDDTEAALQRTAAVLHDVAHEGLDAEEAARSRNVIEARMLRRMETMEGQANLLADWQALGDWRLADDYLRRVLAVTPADLQRVARRYLDPDAGTLLLYRPASAAPFASDVGMARQRVFGGAPVGPDDAQSPADATPDGEPLRDGEPVSGAGPTSQPAAAGSRPLPRLEPAQVEDGVRFYDLAAGGARLALKQRDGVPLVSVALYCRGGTVTETDGSRGLTGLMARTSMKGTRRRSGHQLAAATEALGASIGPGAGADLLDWSVSLPSRHFERGLDLLLEAALEPTFPGAEAERERKLALADLEQVRDDMQQYPLRLALSEAFAGHAYGTSLEALEEGLRSAELASLHDWHRQRVLQAAPHVFVVGDVPDPDVAAALIAARLRDRLEAGRGFAPQTPGWNAGAERVVERDKAQTAIALAFPGPPRNHPDVYPMQVLSSAISGLGGRLFEELRSRRSLAYAVSAMPLPRWLGGAYLAYIGTAPDREAEARAELTAELLRSATEPLPEDELERARRYMIGTWQIRQQTNSSQLGDLAGALLLGEGLAELREHEARIRAVDAAAVQQAARRWLREDQVVTGIVRGR